MTEKRLVDRLIAVAEEYKNAPVDAELLAILEKAAKDGVYDMHFPFYTELGKKVVRCEAALIREGITISHNESAWRLSGWKSCKETPRM